MAIHFEPDQDGEERLGFRTYYPENISSARLSRAYLMCVIKSISSVALPENNLINPIPGDQIQKKT